MSYYEAGDLCPVGCTENGTGWLFTDSELLETPENDDNLNDFQGDYVLEHQLRAMDEAGVDQAIMKLPGYQEWLIWGLRKKKKADPVRNCQIDRMG